MARVLEMYDTQSAHCGGRLENWITQDTELKAPKRRYVSDRHPRPMVGAVKDTTKAFIIAHQTKRKESTATIYHALGFHPFSLLAALSAHPERFVSVWKSTVAEASSNA